MGEMNRVIVVLLIVLIVFGAYAAVASSQVIPPTAYCEPYSGPYPGPTPDPACEFHYMPSVWAKYGPTPTPVLPPD